VAFIVEGVLKLLLAVLMPHACCRIEIKKWEYVFLQFITQFDSSSAIGACSPSVS